jgi:electron transport complex protein RnfA
MTHYLFIIVGAVLVNNVVLVKILGLCPFMGVSRKLETAFGMGAATTFVLTVATGASYIIDHYLLLPFGLEYLRTLSFIVTIAAIVQLTEMVIQKTSPLAAPGARHLPAADHHQLCGPRRATAEHRQPA